MSSQDDDSVSSLPLALARWSMARPVWAIAIMVALMLAAAPGLLRLELRTDGRSLVPPKDPVLRFDAEARRHFGLGDPLLVVIETAHPDGIYNARTLAKVVQLSRRIAALPELETPHAVMSLATEKRDRVYPGTLTFRPFLDPLPEDRQALDVVASDVDAAAILTGTLVSADRRATAIVVAMPAPADEVDREHLYRRIRDLAAPFADGDERIWIAGAPAAEALLGSHLIADLTLLVPLALAVIALVLGLACRNLWGLLLGLGEVGACLIATFGTMGWCGSPVYLTTAVLPVVLTTIGLADEIHIFWAYQRHRGDHDRRAAVAVTMAELARPVVLTSLTTAVGFLSFLASPITAVRAFGLFAAGGIVFCMLWSLTVIPAALVLLPAARPRNGALVGSAGIARLVAGCWRRRSLTLATLVVATLAIGWGARDLEVQDSWIDGFAPGSSFRRATQRVGELFYGTHVLLAHLELRDPSRSLADPAVLDAIGDFESFARARPEVGGVLGTHSQLTAVAYLWLARRQEARQIPRDPRRIELLLERFDQGRGAHRRRQVIDDDRRRTLVTLFLEDANFRDTAALMTALRGAAGRQLEPLGVELAFAGDVAVSQAMIPAIVETQVSSLMIALAGACLALALLYRSLALALTAFLPTAVAVLWVFGVMGWLGIPLGVATSMFCAITLGIGVDYSIHFLERYRQARAAAAPAPHRVALETAGPAIVADTVAIALGFGLLTFSQVPANARLGLLVALALLSSCLLTLVGLSTWLASPNDSGVPAAARSTLGERIGSPP